MNRRETDTGGRPWGMDDRCDLTPRGRAYMIAIETGLIRGSGGRDGEAFGAFWDRVEAEVIGSARKGARACRATLPRS